MTQSSTYSVVISDGLQEGFEPDQVHVALASLFNIPPERVGALLKGRRVIKKAIDRKTAEAYKRKLESIGLVVMVKEHTLPPLDSGLSLSPTTLVEELPKNDTPARAASGQEGHMDTCPKCNAQQPRGNEQCQSCGVYLHKVRNPAVEVDSAPPMQETDTTGESMYPAEEGLSGTSLVAGAGAALLGALIWYLVASIFGYELGLVAWAVGGGVGFAVAATGSSGQSAGIACAVFALVAIFGGKYITYASFHDEIEQTLASSKDDVRYLYEAEMAEAQAYAGVYDDDSLRQFMVEYDYSQFYDVSEVTDEEIDYFLENFESRLRHLADSQTTFDDWYRATLDENLGNLSTTDMMMEDFGVVDIVFLLLGIATAFRLGRGTEAA